MVVELGQHNIPVQTFNNIKNKEQVHGLVLVEEVCDLFPVDAWIKHES